MADEKKKPFNPRMTPDEKALALFHRTWVGPFRLNSENDIVDCAGRFVIACYASYNTGRQTKQDVLEIKALRSFLNSHPGMKMRGPIDAAKLGLIRDVKPSGHELTEWVYTSIGGIRSWAAKCGKCNMLVASFSSPTADGCDSVVHLTAKCKGKQR